MKNKKNLVLWYEPESGVYEVWQYDYEKFFNCMNSFKDIILFSFEDKEVRVLILKKYNSTI